MRVIVFAGPSLPPAERPAIPGFTWRPPLRMGDLARAAAAERPAVLGVIDGAFEVIPTVWHKEILWAMAQGIAVFGAASIGALRAAELAPFGMRGVGAVFAVYRDGTLIDDDEVALLHGPEEAGFPPASEAMVNVRATLDAARFASVVTAVDAARIAEVAKAIFYKARTWPAVLQAARAAGAIPAAQCKDRSELERLHADKKRAGIAPLVTPAQAGVQANGDGGAARLDSRLRGNDGRGRLCAAIGQFDSGQGEAAPRTSGIAPAALDALASWLPSGRVDQKRRDALEMVQAIAEHLAAGLEPPAVNCELAVTSALARVGVGRQ